MRENIVLFSHNKHAFILNEIKYAAKIYKKVLVVMPSSDEVESVCKKYDNVSLIPFNRNWNVGLFICSLLYVDRIVLGEVCRAISQKVATIDYLKDMMYFLLAYRAINKVYKSEIKQDPDNWIMVSMWFFCTAYAISRLKVKDSKLTAVSLAHAFEIDDLRNKQIDFTCKKFCHEKLGYISFISKVKMEEYIRNHVVPNGWKNDILHLDYLGVEKKYPQLCSNSDNEPYHIMTCCRCIPLKRLDLLIEALALINEYQIVWTHFGDGELLDDLKRQASDLADNIKVIWMGNKTNEEIHKYYVSNCIDMTINLSTTEGVPVALLEALAYGVPIIAADVGGNCEIVDENTGILLDKDPTQESIKESIIQLIEMTSIEKENMKKNIFDRYERFFNAAILGNSFYTKIRSNEDKIIND